MYVMYVCMYVMYVMYVCMYVCMCVYVVRVCVLVCVSMCVCVCVCTGVSEITNFLIHDDSLKKYTPFQMGLGDHFNCIIVVCEVQEIDVCQT